MGGQQDLDKLLDLILSAAKGLTAAVIVAVASWSMTSGELLTRVAQEAA